MIIIDVDRGEKCEGVCVSERENIKLDMICFSGQYTIVFKLFKVYPITLYIM